VGHDLAAFLDPEQIRRSSAEAGLGDAATQPLLELAARITNDAALLELASAAHHAVYDSRDDFTEATRRVDAAFGAEAGELHALFVLDSLRLVREKQALRGVAVQISRAVNARHGVAFLKRGLGPNGRVAVQDWVPAWFRRVGGGELYRLGRLEFMPEPWDHPFRAYSNAHTGESIVLAETGVACGRDGHLDGATEFETRLSEESGAVLGSPISPLGYCVREPVRLPLSEWHLELARGDRVLDLHVPAEGALSLTALHDALTEAEPFFDQHYPDRRFVAYACDSWLFSTQLEAMLAADSNILAWQRQGYLVPTHGAHESFLSFTFGSRSIDLETAPRDTRLRRGVIEHLERGGRLRGGAWLLLRRDLSRFGAEPYRTSSASALRRMRVEHGV